MADQAQQGKWEEWSYSGRSFRSLLQTDCPGVRDVLESQGVHLSHRGRQESRHNDSKVKEPSVTDGHTKNRSLPLLTFLEILKEKIGKDYV